MGAINHMKPRVHFNSLFSTLRHSIGCSATVHDLGIYDCLGLSMHGRLLHIEAGFKLIGSQTLFAEVLAFELVLKHN